MNERRAVLLAAGLLLAVAARAAPLQLEALTSTELRARIAAGATTALLPIGGTEQNGPHMALGKHNVRARVLAERIAERLGDALVAPVLAYVPEGRIEPPQAHMRYPGTLSIPEPAFEAVLEGAAASLCHAGFRDVVLLGDHGGYQKNLVRVAARFKRDGCRVHAPAEYYRAAQSGYARLLAARGYGAGEIGEHAGLADTSLALAVDPSLVRAEWLGRASTPAQRVGVSGDPRRASVELGQLGTALIVEETAAVIRERTAKR
ncbi:creatininase family protein [Piscinibacter sp.]|uniref:creatininase family protein n=1 Tax=Piscinibacter sp. TaxID=1903157 RepID=UPI0039E38636